jgi:hypothetical protein
MFGADGAVSALRQPDVRPMDFTGRVLATMLFVAPRALGDAALGRWVETAATFVRALPAKRRAPS